MADYVYVSGKDIAELVDQIDGVVEGVPNVHVTTACLVVAILAQQPDIAPDKLQECVKGASEFIAAVLFGKTGEMN